jgi:hypothetical protein
MKPHGLLAGLGCCVAVLCIAGCSTVPRQIGSSDAQLTVGQKYVLKRDAILLGRRGLINSIESPDYAFESYQPYRDYDPYYVQPIGVVPAGTVIEVKKIRMFKGDRFDVEGEILSGEYKRQPVSVYGAAKGLTVGSWPPTGKVMMENLCGGIAFDPGQLARNLSQKDE